ncbi:hypothetical protein H2201_000206 [Coniosporium apollinis]|uniref:NADH dehydrogenase (Ubiquinone) 1 alpha subcomplex 5 n=2 Tax=Coniosporium TaxID=2810619 RepID=A0ABQ9P862_9PEZI|nr:hypothetical protein H2199_008152 [Cladosporium sp. JES 115]KAJ9669820.1 hypothetical protein H2201_000206 [Coniosporium apollinis]
MRPALRLLAAVKSSRFLESGAPTGLTGLFTHPSPRSTLMYLYSGTLDKLKAVPEYSVYRQSTEALTRHRLAIIESVKPEGFDQWAARVRKQIEAHPDAFEKHGTGVKHSAAGKDFVTTRYAEEVDEREEEWDSEPIEAPELEGVRNSVERKGQAEAMQKEPAMAETVAREFMLEPEPPLTIEQVNDLENRIGAGLIEEVIQVAEGEYQLVDKMVESKVWEELEEKAPEGQWSYFERGGARTSTQAP